MSSVRRRKGGVVVSLSPEERQLLVTLCGAVRAMLEDDGTEPTESDPDPLAALVGLPEGPVEAPEDPVLRRLLPDAYGDPTLAAEFRRLTDADLRANKVQALSRVVDDLATGDDVVLDTDEGGGLWVQAINDVRLMLGTRLDVTEEWTEVLDALPPDDPRIPLFLFYDWLSMLQEALVNAVMRD